MKDYKVGIDIGSTAAKVIVLDKKDKIVERILCPTGWSSKDTSEKLFSELKNKNFTKDNSSVVATGYGRVSVEFADKCVTEITCHGRGASYLFNEKDLLVIDIGGQDTKIIEVHDGNVVDFLMNDKCSAGTGRFLEVMCNTLGLKIDELCTLAEKGKETHISSLCTVFAESEVTSLIGRGEPKENIAYGIIDSIVKKVGLQATKLYKSGIKVCLTGGLSSIPYISKMIGIELKTNVLTNEDGRYAGAIGAALTKI